MYAVALLRAGSMLDEPSQRRRAAAARRDVARMNARFTPLAKAA